jgi:hypothetical protein
LRAHSLRLSTLNLKRRNYEAFSGCFSCCGFFASTLPCVAAEPIPFKALSESSSALPTYAAMSASADGQSSTAAHSGKRHLSTAGKVLLWVGVGTFAVGATYLAAGFAVNQNTCVSGDISSNGISCSLTTAQVYKYYGAGMAGTGAILAGIGLTRRTTDY